VAAGLALNVSLQNELQEWRQKQLSLVRSVTGQISQITDLDKLTDVITGLIQETFNYYYVAVFLIDPDSGCLRFKASAAHLKAGGPNSRVPNIQGSLKVST